jgi:hypothetical protein
MLNMLIFKSSLKPLVHIDDYYFLSELYGQISRTVIRYLRADIPRLRKKNINIMDLLA